MWMTNTQRPGPAPHPGSVLSLRGSSHTIGTASAWSGNATRESANLRVCCTADGCSLARLQLAGPAEIEAAQEGVPTVLTLSLRSG
jgi:hypothetical protein